MRIGIDLKAVKMTSKASKEQKLLMKVSTGLKALTKLEYLEKNLEKFESDLEAF